MLISRMTEQPAKTAGQKFRLPVAPAVWLQAERQVTVLLEPAAWQVPPGEEQSCPQRCPRTAAKRCFVRA
jgi:hypothetical protein